MTEWKSILATSLAETVALVAQMEVPDLPEQDRRRLAEAQGLMSSTIQVLAASIDDDDKEAGERCLATLEVLREVLEQTEHLGAILASKAMLAAAKKIGQRGVRLALEIAATTMIATAS